MCFHIGNCYIRLVFLFSVVRKLNFVCIMATGDAGDSIRDTPRPVSPILMPNRRVLERDEPELFYDSVAGGQPSPQTPFQLRRGCKEESLSKWNLTFSGETCVREFFFRVEEERDSRGACSEYIVRRFHELLSGSALKYFRSIRTPGISYTQLKAAFFRTFDVVDYDFKVERELRGLKQGATQSVRDFVIDARDLNSKLSSPLDEETLFNIVRYGMHPRYYPCLSTSLVMDIESLLRVVKNFESFQLRPEMKITVAPVAVETPPVCLKCGESGHQYRACVKLPGPVCFRCKRVGVITRDCTSCNVTGSKN